MKKVKPLNGYCCPNTTNCPRYKGDEVTVEDMLKQVLENQQVLLWHLTADCPAKKWANDHLEDTKALLEKLK